MIVFVKKGVTEVFTVDQDVKEFNEGGTPVFR